MLKSNKIYLRATIISISVILINQLFIQYWLYQKKEDAEVINISGKQRMYSQKILAGTYRMYLDPSASNLTALKSVYDSWEKSHQLLLNRYQQKSIFGNFNQAIHTQLERLSPKIDRAAYHISKHQQLDTETLNNLQNNQNQFLYGMNTIVNQLESHSSWKLQVVIIVEIIFALLSLFMIYYEITHVFKRIAIDLEAQNKALGNSNQMLEQYAYLAAHDLRSPTQNIINFSNLLSKKLTAKLNRTERTYFQFILDAANRMQRTTDDLLTFSSINHGKIKVEECQPREILKNVFKDIALSIKEKNAKINIGQLPGTIKADKGLIHLVFQNLISNGIKFVPESTQPELDIFYKSEASKHVFTISDNGIGIPEEDQSKIFNLFKRLHRQEQYKGTGIGLSICQKVIEKHKGEMHIESVIEQGSHFSFSISKHLDH